MIKPFIKDRRSGDIYIDEALRYAKGGFLAPSSDQNPITITAAPSATVPKFGAPVILEGPEDAFSEVLALMATMNGSNATAQALATVEITDNAFRRRLMNRDILVEHVFGSNIRPFRVCESLWLEPQQTLQMQFKNNSVAGSIVIEQANEIQKFQSPVWKKPSVAKTIAENANRKRRLYPFWLTTDAAVSLAASASAEALFTVTKDIRMIVFGSIARAITVGSLGDTTELVLAEFFDSVSQRPLQNQPLARTICSGTVEFPYYFPCGWIIDPNTTIRGRFTNLVTNGITQVFWTFFGVASYME